MSGLFIPFVKKRNALLVTAIIGIVALKFAFISQYIFGYNPCELCLYQRWPFAIVIILGLSGFIYNTSLISQITLSLSALSFTINTMIAFFHVGVEQKWWDGLSSCSGNFSSTSSLEDIKNTILSAPLTRCDDVSWEFLGLSMATYNVLLCLTLTVYCVYVLIQKRHNESLSQ
jgi:disulfide bond formation protein DsbB